MRELPTATKRAITTGFGFGFILRTCSDTMDIVAIPSVISDFARHSEHQSDVEPDIIETLADFKESYFGDPDPTRWQADVLRELMLGVLPRKVTADEDWFAAVVPTTRAYLEFLSTRKRLARGSDPVPILLAEVDRIGDGVIAASRDPRNFGMAKSILSAVGFDPSVPDSISTAMEAFNALPDEQRAAILDPALGAGNLLAPSPFEDDAFEDADEIWPSLPLTWLPPVDELAAAVRSAPLVESLLQLAAWNGVSHKVTRQEVLALPAARRACADLGLPLPATAVRAASQIPALHRLWSLATDSEILEIDGSLAVRGEAADLLTDPGQATEAVVAWWIELFASCLDWGIDVAEDPDLDDDEDEEGEILDVVDDVLTATLAELYPGIGVPASGLEEVITATVEESCAEYLGFIELSREELVRVARQRWTAHVAQLVDLGAAAVEDDILSLTPLGRVGVRALALAAGADAPLADDPAALDAATLLESLPLLGTPVAEPLLAAWSGARSPDRATQELLDAARTGAASVRMAAVTVLMELFQDHITGAGRPHFEALRDDPVLGLSAHILLTQPGQALSLPPPLRQWAALEAVAVAVESGVLDEAESAAKVWELVDTDADLDSAWRRPHPQLIEILEAVATRHPKGRTRKAAKKALFKARHPEKSR